MIVRILHARSSAFERQIEYPFAADVPAPI